MKTRQLTFARLVLAVATLLLAACAPALTVTPAPSATPTVARLAPTATLPPSPTLPPAPTQAPAATPAPTDSFDGWKTITTDAFAITLPADWEVIGLSEKYIETVMEKLAEKGPVIGAMLRTARPDLEQFELFAIGPEIDGVADGMNVLRLPPSAERPRDLDEFLREMIEPQFDLAGYKPTGKRADLRTDEGLPMARIVFTPPQLGDGPEMRGRQYYVLTDTDLWVLTYTTVADRTGRAPTEFEKSAKTFSPR